eukprot:5899880-Lingulodinium_polyedra.AAC.1
MPSARNRPTAAVETPLANLPHNLPRSRKLPDAVSTRGLVVRQHNGIVGHLCCQCLLEDYPRR